MLIPKPFKKFLAIFRGKVSFLMILLSVALGFWFGLTPGWTGFHTAILCVSLILNIHIGLFLLFAGLGKAVLYAAAPAVYHIGMFVHEHVKGLVDFFASVPVIAMTDFSKVSIAGAMLLGPIIGLILGFVLAQIVGGFRKKYLKLHTDSERFQKWYSKKWVRVLDRFLIGKSAKDPEEIVKGKGPVIRKAGVALVVLIAVIGVIATYFTPEEKVRTIAADRLTKANGAEVNLEEMMLKPLEGKLSAAGIQVTDGENPSVNKFAAEKLTADASLAGFLMGKVVIDDIEVTGLTFDTPRETPGEVVDAGEEKQSRPPINPEDLSAESLEKYLKNAQKIKDMFQKISKYLPGSKDKPESKPREIPDSVMEYINARTQLPPAAKFVARRISFDGVEIPLEALGKSAVEILNISDAPAMSNEPIRVRLGSEETAAKMDLEYLYAVAEDGENLTGEFSGMELAKFGSIAGMDFAGGLAKGKIGGTLLQNAMDVSVDVVLSEMKLAGGSKGLFGLDRETTAQILESMDNMPLKIRLTGSPRNPQVSAQVDALAEQFRQKAVEMGKQKVMEKVDEQIGGQVDKSLGEGAGKAIREGLKGLFGGKKEEE